MTDTPTTQAWMIVEGTSYDWQHVAAVFGTRDDAQQIADDWNRNRIREALEVDAETIKPVRVLDEPLPGHMFAALALHQGDHVRVTDSRTLAQLVGIVAKASDDELVVGIHAEDNGPGAGIAALAEPLYRALHQWRYGDGPGRNLTQATDAQRLRVFQAAPELTKRLDALLEAYVAHVGKIHPLVRDAEPGDGDDRGLPIGKSYRDDAGDAYVGPPRIVAIARFVVRPQDWAKYAPGNLTGDADGFATYVAGVIENAVTGDLVMAGRVGHAVRIESDR